jgi:chemotaxis methyl-accepting protein methylase
MNADRDQVFGILQQVCGQDMSVFSRGFLTRALETRMAVMGLNLIAEYADILAENPAECGLFFHSLKIHYSEFFRDPVVFALLAHQVLPTLIQRKKAGGQQGIRIWSAGCAAGEEAYSIAMILNQFTEEGENCVPFRIFATDVSEAVLERAREGRYPLTAVQQVPMGYYQRYFSPLPDGCLLHADVKRGVDFSIHDLLNPTAASPAASIYGDFDVILCCNVLFYYTTEVQLAILRRLRQSLSPRGILVTGYVEQDSVRDSGLFRAMMPQGSVFECG